MRAIHLDQETANTSFSPDGRVLVCGSNVRPKSGATGVLKFFDVYTGESEPELGAYNGQWRTTSGTVVFFAEADVPNRVYQSNLRFRRT